MVTIKDVAKLAGVSISTVSRVINDSKPVSKEVREKVLEIVKETGYRPNDVARSLVTRRSYLIGVIVNDLSNSYVAEMVKGVEEVGKMYDFDILLCSSYYDKEAQLKYLSLLDRKQAEGLILIGYKYDEEIIQKLKDLNKPTIFFTRDIIDESLKYVKIDSKSAMFEMTNYVIKNGHKNLLYVSDYEEKSTYENDKIQGFKHAMEDNDVNKYEILEVQGRKYKDGYRFGEKLSSKDIDYSAIICTNDEIAYGIMNALSDNGIKVPEDVSVVGYGGYKESKIIRPSLTTISEPYYDIGAVAIRNLIKEIESEEKVENKINLPFTLIKRDSLKNIKK
ncbi:MAG: LacI family DNA-binding transcriptional regulator [Eubacteriales bacterium]